MKIKKRRKFSYGFKFSNIKILSSIKRVTTNIEEALEKLLREFNPKNIQQQ